MDLASLLIFAGALTVATGLLFGLFPALHSTRPDLLSTLKGQSGQPSGARAAARFRMTLATAQIALSMALLVSAGLFTKSLFNVSRVDLGVSVAWPPRPLSGPYGPRKPLADISLPEVLVQHLDVVVRPHPEGGDPVGAPAVPFHPVDQRERPGAVAPGELLLLRGVERDHESLLSRA